jgi:hypothetical protein
MDRFKEARDRGGAYLVNVQNPDGSFPGHEKGVDSYWGMLDALIVTGHSDRANLLCDWIRKNALTPEGDVGFNRKKGLAYPYPISWVVEGAHRLGQFDVSQRGMDFIMTYWDPESGGFYSTPGEFGPEGKQDLWIISSLGRAALYTGRVDVSLAAGGWMQRLMELQPNYPAQMHTTYSRAKGIHTEAAPGDDIRRYIFNLDATTDERFFNPGIASGFLARLYMATGEDRWLDLAREYMRCCDNASDYLYTILRAGKTGWAASLLYTLTGERRYRDIAVRIGETLLRTQAESGYWSGLDRVEETPSYGRTAEMTIWLDEIYQGVGHEPAAESSREPAATAAQRA